MRKLGTVASCFIGAGLLAIAGGAVYHHNQSVSDSYRKGTLDQLRNYDWVRTGKSGDLMDKIERDLPTHIRALHLQFPGEESDEVLYQVKNFYSTFPGLELPKDCRDILDSLPSDVGSPCER